VWSMQGTAWKAMIAAGGQEETAEVCCK